MSLKVTFELEEKDLKFFRTCIKQARQNAANSSEAEITATGQVCKATVQYDVGADALLAK